MGGIPVATEEMPQMLQLYLMCSPSLDLHLRFLPKAGGLLDQDYCTIRWFLVIEDRIKDILHRKKKEK